VRGIRNAFFYLLPYSKDLLEEELKYKPLRGLALVPAGFVKEENIYYYSHRDKNGMNIS
jgi:hypothetical protein